MQTQTNTTELGIALLRVTLGVMFIAHALLKIFVFTLPGTAGFFESVGLPGALAYVVTPVELLGGIALVAGLKTRWVSLALLPVLIGAASVHAGNGWVFSAPNGGWEYPVYLAIAALSQALLGGGAFAFDNLRQIQLPRLGQAA
ncbi:DoxX family protein [Denitromonas halophila]|uniref:DoxX family protein n=1 Tax=Denitromonas halophila TaxID=1629404 RepID=A0A557QYY9_9RHOO|nr:DoxX family protein [Denitromonas halophila]TVO58076.1 DoxX family protein [Denitromonas halophila]